MKLFIENSLNYFFLIFIFSSCNSLKPNIKSINNHNFNGKSTESEKPIKFECSIISFTKPQGFGGISALEFTDNTFHFVSDRQEEKGYNPKSFDYVFSKNLTYETSKSDYYHKLEDVESLRFNKKDGNWYYTTESDKRYDITETKVGFIENDIPTILYSYSSSIDSRVFQNTGIESLTFQEDGTMWHAFESVNKKTNENSLDFISTPWDPNSNKFDTSKREIFKYNFDKNKCTTKVNGKDKFSNKRVTEILNYDKDHLLVLEVCFVNGIKPDNSDDLMESNLILAKINRKDTTLLREVLINLDNNDNLEGMTWGPKTSNGKRTLYIVSDNNHKSDQKNILLELIEK